MKRLLAMLIVVVLAAACAPAVQPATVSGYYGETARGKVVGIVKELKSWTTDSMVMNSIRLDVTSSKVKEITKGEQLLDVRGADAGGLHVDEKAAFICAVIHGGTESQSVVCQLAQPFKDLENEN